MQQRTRRVAISVVASGLILAALQAPLPVLAEGASSPTTTPPQSGTTPPTPTPPPTPSIPAQPANGLRVGLGRSLATARVAAQGALYVIADNAMQMQTTPGQALNLEILNGQIRVVELAKAFNGPIRLVPVPAATPAPFPAVPANPVQWNGKSYRGELEVLKNANGALSVVNVLDLEEYLLGVVPKEMPSDWHAEALKAQAVASRTYAVYLKTISRKYPNEGFDAVDTTESQVYGGLASEVPASTRAVADTKGQLVKTNTGQVVAAFFHASSGGYTENNENIWTGGSAVSYLRGVPDFDNVPGNSRYSWRYTVTGPQLLQAFGVGSITSIVPSGMGVSGRPVNWQVTASDGSTVTKTGGVVRSALALPSNPKQLIPRPEVQVATSGTYATIANVSVISKGRTVTEVAVKNATVVGAGRTLSTPTTQVVASGLLRQNGGADVVGGGWGHGLGLSQWGAYGMALQGRTYKQILTYYYQGTKVE